MSEVGGHDGANAVCSGDEAEEKGEINWRGAGGGGGGGKGGDDDELMLIVLRCQLTY